MSRIKGALRRANARPWRDPQYIFRADFPPWPDLRGNQQPL